MCPLSDPPPLSPQNHATLSKMAALLEDTVFTADVNPQLLEVFQQFQALLKLSIGTQNLTLTFSWIVVTWPSLLVCAVAACFVRALHTPFT